MIRHESSDLLLDTKRLQQQLGITSRCLSPPFSFCLHTRPSEALLAASITLIIPAATEGLKT